MAPDNGLAVAALNELSEAIVLSGASQLLNLLLAVRKRGGWHKQCVSEALLAPPAAL